MAEQFDNKFIKAVSSIQKLAKANNIAPYTFYKVGLMISNLPIKCIHTKLILEAYINSENYNKAIILLNSHLV